MKELEIKGYPTLIGKDATTGEIKWEKTLKNTLTMHERMWRAYASSINSTVPIGDITNIETIQIKNIEISDDKANCFDLCIDAITKIPILILR